METARCKAFLAAADLGSFTKAAEALRYTPSGVSQLVNALEADLGFPLLRRTNKGVTATAEAEALMPVMREFIRQEDRIYQLSADTRGLLVGSITIASYSSIATHWMPRVISRFQADFPDVRINMLEGVRQEVLRWLEDRRADIGFMSYWDPFQYDWIPLKRDRMMALLPRSHPLANADSFPIERCRTEKLILPAFGHDDDVMALFSEFDIEPDVAFATVESYSAFKMVEQGLGICVTNELITESWECDIAKVPIAPARSIAFGMALPSIKNASPAVKKFTEYARDIIME